MTDDVVVIAEVFDYSGLHAAFRAQADRLNISRTTIDDVAGLTPGHASKMLQPIPTGEAGRRTFRSIGKCTLGPMLGTLGLKLLVVEDPDALARVQSRLVPRDLKRVRTHMPRYRAIEDNTNLGCGFYKKGQEFDWQGWPKCFGGAVEGVNAASRRLIQYWSAHRQEALCPLTPYSSEHGRIFLPHHLPRDPRSTRLPPLPYKELDGMPRYKATWQQNFAGREVTIGEEIAYCGWPEHGLEPINDAARQVVEYFEANRGNPKLLPAPWCDYAQELFLPELPMLKPGPGYARDISRDRDVWHDQIMRERLDEARAQLNAPITAKRHSGSRRRVSA